MNCINDIYLMNEISKFTKRIFNILTRNWFNFYIILFLHSNKINIIYIEIYKKLT